MQLPLPHVEIHVSRAVMPTNCNGKKLKSLYKLLDVITMGYMLMFTLQIFTCEG